MQRNVLNLQNAFVGLAGAAALGQIRQSYGEYDAALRDMGKVTEESMGVIAAKIGEVPAELGNATELIQGYYQVISAGITEPVKAMDTLTSSTETAKAAHVAQAEVIKGITKVMAGYAGDVKTAADAADLLFTIEKQGQTSFAELIPVIGDVAAISKQLGVEQQEMGAALAAVTLTAGSTSQAATQYRMMLVNLMKPTKDMQEALDGIGASSGQAAIEQFGLAGTLARLQEYATSSGKSVAKLFESSEALLSVAALSRGEFAQYNTNLQAMEQRAGAADKAFRQWKDSTQAVDDLFRNTMTNTLIKIGGEIMPMVNDSVREFAEFVAAHDDEIAGTFGEMAEYGRQIGTALVPALRDVGGVLTDSVIPAVAQVAGVGKEILSLVPEEYQSAVGGGILGYALLGPKGGVIVAKVLALTAAAKTAAEYMHSLTGGIGDFEDFHAEVRGRAEKEYNNLLSGLFSGGEAESLDDLLKRREDALRKIRQAQKIPGGDNGAMAQRELDKIDDQIVELEKRRLTAVQVVGKTFVDVWQTVERQTSTGVAAVSGSVAAAVSGLSSMSDEQKKSLKEQERLFDQLDKMQLAGRLKLTESQDGLLMRNAGMEAAKSRAAAYLRDISQEDLQLQTEFAEKYREIVLGETAAKLASIDEQGRAYVAAGSDEIAVAQWVSQAKLAESREWADGAKRGLAEYADSATNAAQLAQDAVTSGFRGMEDALVSFVTTGKMEFSDLASSIISDLARIAIQQSITGPLASAAGGFISGMFGGGASSAAGTAGAAGTLSSFMSRSAKGNVFSGPGISEFSNTIVSQPTQFWAKGGNLMGEAGPEAIMPLKRGPDGSLGVRGGGASVTVNVINNSSAGASVKETKSSGGTRLDIVIEDIVARSITERKKVGQAIQTAFKAQYKGA
jgi:lambda family phage tail tape measure protein/TP901 family phage tail tape measure protein